jgi:hypothetical protein
VHKMMTRCVISFDRECVAASVAVAFVAALSAALFVEMVVETARFAFGLFPLIGMFPPCLLLFRTFVLHAASAFCPHCLVHISERFARAAR